MTRLADGTAAAPTAKAAMRVLATLSDFGPPWWLRDPHVQSVLASVEPRRGLVRRRARGLAAASTPVVLDCGDGVRLAGAYARGESDASLVVLIHGWEGSVDSSYVLSAGTVLRDLGHSVFRLNLRDHGETFDLNPGIFHSCRLQEVIGAVATIGSTYRPQRLSLVGFSLGGNFALRVAAHRGAIPLERVVAVCPVLDPTRTMHALDSGASLYQRYFILKWSRSLKAKARTWPVLYDFRDVDSHVNLTQMTDLLVREHTEFDSLSTYLNGYALTGERLAALDVPATILAALDDPIIPADDLDRLARPATLSLALTERGGHCGFLDTLAGPSYADRFIARTLGRP